MTPRRRRLYDRGEVVMKPNNKAQAIAVALFEEGRCAQQAGDLKRALKLYSRSIAMHPTAEAYTYRGWALSYYGEYERAIADCQRAIEIDPDFGNPYNDIGAYLIALGKADDAVFWLRKAAVAKRYDSRCFAFMNLGRVHLAKGQMIAALRCFETAFRHNDDYEPALYLAEATRLRIH